MKIYLMILKYCNRNVMAINLFSILTVIEFQIKFCQVCLIMQREHNMNIMLFCTTQTNQKYQLNKTKNPTMYLELHLPYQKFIFFSSRLFFKFVCLYQFDIKILILKKSLNHLQFVFCQPFINQQHGAFNLFLSHQQVHTFYNS